MRWDAAAGKRSRIITVPAGGGKGGTCGPRLPDKLRTAVRSATDRTGKAVLKNKPFEAGKTVYTSGSTI
ncbi:MAG: hypothetical protein Q8O82_04105 [Pseudorhodobacter sp.]|nr:hypothetical protein [Pseudorhodobacter sp.]